MNKLTKIFKITMNLQGILLELKLNSAWQLPSRIGDENPGLEFGELIIMD